MLGFLVVLSGCSMTEITLEGTRELNDRNAAEIHVYQLAGKDEFDKLIPRSFSESGIEALGNDFLKVEPVIRLLPDSTRIISFKNVKGAKFIGIVADLRDPDPLRFKGVSKLKRMGKKKIRAVVGESLVTVTD